MTEGLLEVLAHDETDKVNLGQLPIDVPREINCDYCGRVIYRVPFTSDALFGNYCDRACFLLDFNRDNIYP